MAVTNTNPSSGETLTVSPTSFVVDFSLPYEPSSVQASDFKVNGIPAKTVSQTDADTLTFHYESSPASVAGAHMLEIAANAITTSNGQAASPGVTAFSTTFYLTGNSVPAPSGLVAWWTGDGTANDSAGTNHGLLAGGASYAAGRVGQAFNLDGIDDYIRVPSSAALNPAAGFSIEAWIRSNRTDGPRVIVSKWNDNSGDWSYIFKDHNYADTLRIELSKNTHTDMADLGGSTNIAVGEWIHVAMTYEPGTLRLYYDGVLDSFTAVNPQEVIQASATDLLIGAVFTGGGVHEHFSGLIDEVSLYNRALADTEVRSIALAGAAGKQRAMVVSRTSPAAGSSVAAPPSDFVVDLSHPYAAASVQAGDFTVNGIPADSVIQFDTDTLKFHFNNSPVSAAGSQTMAIAAGAIETSAPGFATPGIAAFSGVFEFRPPSISVLGSKPLAGTTVLTAPTQFSIDFSLPFDESSVQPGDLTVNGIPADSVVVSSATRLTFQYDVSPVTVEGEQAMGIVEGAITSLGGGGGQTAVEAWSNTFRYAAIPTPIAWWSGDGTAADAVGGHHGTLRGDASFAPGLIGQGFRFDGVGDHIEVPDSPAWAFGSGDLTIELWAKMDAVGGGGDNESFVSQAEGPGPQKRWAYFYDGFTDQSGLAHGQMQFHQDGSAAGPIWIGQTLLLTPGTWHHHAITKRGSAWTHFVDGNPIGISFDATQLLDVAAPLLIGGFAGGNFFNGMIDELKIYDRALSAFEINSIYQPAPPAAVAVEDLYTVAKENTLRVAGAGVLTNDAAGLHAVLVTPPTHGTLSLSANGSFTYTPAAGFVGRDSFTYRASGAVTANVATAAIDVTVPVSVALPFGGVTWWRGDGNPDDSLGTNDGAFRGNTLIGDGKVGQAFHFDGDQDFVEIGDSPALALGSEDFTINMWVNPTQMEPGTALLGQSEGGGAQNKWGLYFDGFTNQSGASRGVLSFHYHSPNIAGSGVSVGTSDVSIVPGRWYNVAVVRGGANWSLYLDGELIGTSTETTPIPDVAAPLTIGAFEGGNYFTGAIDEVMIYDRALVSTEVRSIYEAASAGLVIFAEEGRQFIDGWAQQLFLGIPDGGSPELYFETHTNNDALFSRPPKIDSTGRLTFTPAPNSSGSAVVTVVLRTRDPLLEEAEGEGGEGGADFADSEAWEQTFTIEVQQENPWQNDIHQADTNHDEYITARDALLVIDYLNAFGNQDLLSFGDLGNVYLDASGDDYLTARDVLVIINEINAGGQHRIEMEDPDAEEPDSGEPDAGEPDSGEPEFAEPELETPEGEAAPSAANLPYSTQELEQLLANDLVEHARGRRKIASGGS